MAFRAPANSTTTTRRRRDGRSEGTALKGSRPHVPERDPRACDGRTTVCPLWLLGHPQTQLPQLVDVETARYQLLLDRVRDKQFEARPVGLLAERRGIDL